MKAIMVDSLVGNDYSICLCSGMAAAETDITLIVPENRVIGIPVEFGVKYWAPTKQQGRNRFKKAFRYLKYLFNLLFYIKKQKIDIVHFQFFRRERIESFYFMLLRLLGVNTVITAHNVLPHQNGKVDYLLKYIVYRSAGAIIAHSNYIKHKITEMFKINAGKIQVIPHGDFDIYLPKHPLSKTEARTKLDLAENDHVLLFFGTIRDNKGLPLLLDAFELAAQSDPQLKLVIAGQPPNEKSGDRYRERIAKIAFKDRVIFHSHFIPDDRVADYFTAADIVALPYRNIYHSGIIHLAFSFGRPIIATRVGDFSETIDHGKSGYLLEENTAADLAAAIELGFSNSQSLKQMGRYARKLSETEYSWKRIARRTGELYKTMVEAT